MSELDILIEKEAKKSSHASKRAGHSKPAIVEQQQEPSSASIDDKREASVTATPDIKSAASIGEYLPLSLIVPAPSPVRKYFDEEKMLHLAASIRRVGIRTPLFVRPLPDGLFELIAGERRFRAAQIASLAYLPVLVMEVSDLEARVIELEDNLLRSDLNAYEQTQGILDLLSLKLNLFPSEVESLLYRMNCEASGKAATHNVMGGSRAQIVMEVFHNLGLMTWESFVKNRLPILKLPDDILFALHMGDIEYTKAKEIAKLRKDDEARQQLLEEAIALCLSLNQIKERVKAMKPSPPPQKAPTPKEVQQTRNRISKLSSLAKVARLEHPLIYQKAQELLSQLEALLSENPSSEGGSDA